MSVVHRIVSSFYHHLRLNLILLHFLNQYQTEGFPKCMIISGKNWKSDLDTDQGHLRRGIQ